MEDKMMIARNIKMFPLCHPPPPFTPSPHLLFAPQESVHSSLLFSCLPPPPLFSSSSFWACGWHYHAANPPLLSLSLLLSLCQCVCADMYQVRDMHRWKCLCVSAQKNTFKEDNEGATRAVLHCEYVCVLCGPKGESEGTSVSISVNLSPLWPFRLMVCLTDVLLFWSTVVFCIISCIKYIQIFEYDSSGSNIQL